MTLIDWEKDLDNTGSSSSNGNKVTYLNLKAGNTYKIRPVLRPIRIWKCFVNNPGEKVRFAIIENPKTFLAW